MAEEKESPISICQVVQNPKKGDCNKSSNFIISTTRASWKRGLKWCQPEACWTSLRGEIRSRITSPPSNWLMTFLQWIQRPCPTKFYKSTSPDSVENLLFQQLFWIPLCRKLRLMIQLYPSATEQVRCGLSFSKLIFLWKNGNSSHISSPLAQFFNPHPFRLSSTFCDFL